MKIRILALLICGYCLGARAQELEPRALTNLPVGMNFVLAGYVFSQGNILLDPAVPIEDLDATLHTGFVAYARSINFFGLSGKVDVIVPFATGDWTGEFMDVDTATSRTGFGDTRVRLSVNFSGAPALTPKEFRNYKQTTVVGGSVQMIMPTGQYNPSKLVNLGSNRWTFRTQFGASQSFGPWITEAYVGAWFFTPNKDFFGGSELTQRPFLTMKAHVVYTLPKGKWIALDAGYGIGARTTIDGDLKDTRLSTWRFGATIAFPFALSHAIKLIAATAVRGERGPAFNAISLAYQYRWGF